MLTRKEILAHLGKYAPLSPEEGDLFFDCFEYRQIKKNAFVVEKDQQSSPFILIKSGYLMTYSEPVLGQPKVLQFGTDMWWTGDIVSFHTGTPCTQHVKALEDAEIFVIHKSDFELLLEKLPQLERYFRILFQNSMVAHQKRLIESHVLSAKEQYEAFIERFPGIEQVAPQKYIASYLGITPEFLSMMKAKMR